MPDIVIIPTPAIRVRSTQPAGGGFQSQGQPYIAITLPHVGSLDSLSISYMNEIVNVAVGNVYGGNF